MAKIKLTKCLSFLATIVVMCCSLSDATAQWSGSPYKNPFSREAAIWDAAHNIIPTYELAYNRAKEAGRNMNGVLRNELEFGIVFAQADYSLHYYTNVDWWKKAYQEPPTIIDTTIKTKIHPNWAYRIASGSGYPFVTLSDNAAILFSYGAAIEFADWTQPATKIDGETREFGMKTVTGAVPLTIDFKTGSEAMLDISKGTCFSFGAGIQPYETFNTNYLDASHRFGLQPMARAEFGFATRLVAVKLRVAGFLGNRTYIKYDNTHYAGDFSHTQDLTVKSPSQFTFSLVVMPLARHWENNAWYRGGR
jgi:hypothetical protein